MSLNITGKTTVTGKVITSTIPAQQIVDSVVPFSTDVATDGNGNWVVVGNGTSTTNRIAYSSDRVNWTLSVTPILQPVLSVATNKVGDWVALLNNGGTYRSTNNGVTWSSVSGAVTDPAVAFVFWSPGVGQFLAVGNTTVTMNSDGSGRSYFSPQIPGTPALKTSAVSSTRAVLAGDNGTSYYTNVGASWTGAGVPVKTIRGGWYEPSLGVYAFVNVNGEVHSSTTGNSGWTTIDIDPFSPNGHEMIIFSPTEQKWVSSNNFTNQYWKTVDTTLTTWVVDTSEFVGATAGKQADSDGSHYVIVTNNNKIVTR